MQEIQETQVQSLGWEDSPGERRGKPLQYSCLENPMDRGASWAAVQRVAKSWTRLKHLSMHQVPSKIPQRSLPVKELAFHLFMSRETGVSCMCPHMAGRLPHP